MNTTASLKLSSSFASIWITMVCSGGGWHHRFGEIRMLAFSSGRSDVVSSALLRNTRTLYQTTRRHALEYGHFHVHRSKNLKYHLSKLVKI